MSFWDLLFVLLIVVPLIMLWVFALVDLFHRDNLSGLAKALWAIAIVLLPIFGMLIYFIARQPTEAEQAAAAEAQHQAAAAVDYTEQLEKLADLKDKGILTNDEFQREKDKLLSGDATS